MKARAKAARAKLGPLGDELLSVFPFAGRPRNQNSICLRLARYLTKFARSDRTGSSTARPATCAEERRGKQHLWRKLICRWAQGRAHGRRKSGTSGRHRRGHIPLRRPWPRSAVAIGCMPSATPAEEVRSQIPVSAGSADRRLIDQIERGEEPVGYELGIGDDPELGGCRLVFWCRRCHRRAPTPAPPRR